MARRLSWRAGRAPGRGSGRSRARSGSTRRGTGCRGSAARAAGGRRRSPGRSRPRPRRAAHAGRPGRRTCCRSRPARRGRRSTTGDWVPWKTMSLYARAIPSRSTERLVAEADREERLLAARAAGRPRSRNVAIFGSSPSRGSPGPGPTMTRSCAVEAPGSYVRVVPHHVAGHAEHAEHVAQHVHEVVLAVEDHARAGRVSAGSGGAPRLVGRARTSTSRWLREPSAISTSSSRASAATSSAAAPARRRPARTR